MHVCVCVCVCVLWQSKHKDTTNKIPTWFYDTSIKNAVICIGMQIRNTKHFYRGADKSLARPGRKQATPTKL